MSRQAITVELPEEIYERIERAARGMKRPVEQALASIVKAAMPSLERVPPEYRSELEDMEILSDEELKAIIDDRMSAAKQRQLTSLLRKNQKDTLTEREQKRLTRLREETDRLMFCRSYACLLLKCRGHGIPALDESG